MINIKILLSIVLNEIFYAFIISEKVENSNEIIEECKKMEKIVII